MARGTQIQGDEPSQVAEAAPAKGTVDQRILFVYKLAAGIAHRSYGLNVARLARSSFSWEEGGLGVAEGMLFDRRNSLCPKRVCGSAPS